MDIDLLLLMAGLVADLEVREFGVLRLSNRPVFTELLLLSFVVRRYPWLKLVVLVEATFLAFKVLSPVVAVGR